MEKLLLRRGVVGNYMCGVGKQGGPVRLATETC